jgi:hypothetical protein
MPLVPCRACEHQVDTSALACPQCGATDPAKKISRQQRDARSFVVQLVVWLCLLSFGGWYVFHVVIPFVKPFIVKTQAEPSERQ